MRHSPLNQFHDDAKAKMVDFAGWRMPIYYRGIQEEHVHTRTQVSAFDVSHMGRIHLQGSDVEAFLQNLCTRNLDGTAMGQSKYSHICREDGGILDDVIVSRHEDHWVVVCNASNREKILAWFQQHVRGQAVNIADHTLDTAMIAVQGPAAITHMQDAFGLDFSTLKRYWFVDGELMGMRYSIFRSGYTGEDGVEAVITAAAVPLVLPRLIEAQGAGPCRPAGLGARDTLRMEAAMPLYGHELLESVDSLSAGQGWCVDLSVDFIGAGALRRLKDKGLTRRLVGMELDGKRIARQGYGILKNGKTIGEVTSGTMSPTLGKSIAMGFVEVDRSEMGTTVEIDLGRKTNEARIVPLPFYKRPR